MRVQIETLQKVIDELSMKLNDSSVLIDELTKKDMLN